MLFECSLALFTSPELICSCFPVSANRAAPSHFRDDTSEHACLNAVYMHTEAGLEDSWTATYRSLHDALFAAPDDGLLYQSDGLWQAGRLYYLA